MNRMDRAKRPDPNSTADRYRWRDRLRGSRSARVVVASVVLSLGVPGIASAQDPDPDEFTPPGYEFCGWKDYANGGWAMEWSDDLAGAYTVAFADGMSCQAARRNVTRTKYTRNAPYRPYRTGYTCKQLKVAHEFADVRCVKRGSTGKFRFQTGS